MQNTILDFSSIDTEEEVKAKVENGELHKMHLFPLELGGEDTPQNTVFVPIDTLETKQ